MVAIKKEGEETATPERGFPPYKGSPDPLRHIYMKRFLIYIVLLTVLLLWPFDLFSKNRVHWLSESNGIEFSGRGIVGSSSPVPEFCRKMVNGRGLTLSLWLAPGNTSQSGPARILSYSLNSGFRNFTIGQEGKNLVIRIRTNKTSLNGTRPHLVVDNVFKTSAILHIVVTYDFIYQTVYINGSKITRKKLPGGKFRNWNFYHYLVFGNETDCGRSWAGRIFQAEIYNRALKENEVISKYEIGWMERANDLGSSSMIAEGLLARYRFNEGQGDQCRNSVSTVDTSMDFFMPKYLRNLTSSYLRWPDDFFANAFKSQDIILNILGFIPLGFFLHGALRNRRGLSWRMSAFVLFTGILLSFFFESLQYYSIKRDSSSVDLLTNTLGTLFGIIIDRSYARHIRHYWATKFNLL